MVGLFHIRGNRTDRAAYEGFASGTEVDFGHAISSDLVVWERRESVVERSPRGSWDEFKVFAPHIVEQDGVYFMFTQD